MSDVFATNSDLAFLSSTNPSIKLSPSDEAIVYEHARRYLSHTLAKVMGVSGDPSHPIKSGTSELGTPHTLEEPCPTLGWKWIKQTLNHEWQRPWQSILRDVQSEGVAGRLGQVHRARLHSGEEVAVKVQYPGIARAIYNELKREEWLFRRITGLGDDIKLAGQRKAFLSGLAEELDYLAESENQQQYEILAKYNFVPNLIVPKVLDDLCTSRVLVSHWEEGSTLEEVTEHWSVSDRQVAAQNFLHHALAFFRQGIIHADLDRANFRFRGGDGKKVELVAYDFGRLFRPDHSLQLALMRLIEMTSANAHDDPYPLFIKIGFNPHLLDPMAHRLPALCRVLFEPFIAMGPYDLEHWQLHERMSAVLGKHYKQFRLASPPQLHLLFGMLQDLTQVLRRLRTPLSWLHIMNPVLASWRKEIAALSLEEPEIPERGFGNVAVRVVIRVIQGGELEYRRNSPLLVLERLEETLDAQLRDLMSAAGLDLPMLRRGIHRRGYRPGQAFAGRAGNREIQIWLE